jgi:four helix bundle protein
VKEGIEERSFRFALRILAVADPLFRRGGLSRQLGSQLAKAGTSIGANVSEAQAAQSRADFVSKCSIAAKEARETLYWLRLINDAQVLPEKRLRNLKDEAGQIVAILTTIVKKAGAPLRR